MILKQELKASLNGKDTVLFLPLLVSGQGKLQVNKRHHVGIQTPCSQESLDHLYLFFLLSQVQARAAHQLWFRSNLRKYSPS